MAAAGRQFHNLGTFPPRHHRHRGRSADLLCLSLILDVGQMALTWRGGFKLVSKGNQITPAHVATMRWGGGGS